MLHLGTVDCENRGDDKISPNSKLFLAMINYRNATG